MRTTKTGTKFLFIGNYDNGIVVTGDRDGFAGKATGKLAQKCVDVAPRALHLLGPGDAALLYAPLDPQYEDYLGDLYGYRPQVFHPADLRRDPESPLSLLESVLGDADLLRRIAEEGKRHGWTIVPFVSHPLVHELGRRTGLPVAGMAERAVMDGKVSTLNDKAIFQDACRKLGIPTPPSAHVRGWDDILRHAAERFRRDGAVMLRRTRAAGGLGNCQVDRKILEASGCATVQEYLERSLLPRDEWDSETVLVEPMLDVRLSPTTLFRVDESRLRLIADSCRILESNASIGGVIPSSIHRDTLDRLVTLAHRYGGFVRVNGGSGYFDIDWGVLADGSLVAFESNYRVTGNNHPVAIRQRLRPDNASGLVTASNDALKVADVVTFGEVRTFLDDTGYGWSEERGEGVVVTIPPAGGSMGYVAIAESNRDAMAYLGHLRDFAARTKRGDRRVRAAAGEA